MCLTTSGEVFDCQVLGSPRVHQNDPRSSGGLHGEEERLLDRPDVLGPDGGGWVKIRVKKPPGSKESARIQEVYLPGTRLVTPRFWCLS